MHTNILNIQTYQIYCSLNWLYSFFYKYLPSPICVCYRDQVYGFLMNFIEQHNMPNHNI